MMYNTIVKAKASVKDAFLRYRNCITRSDILYDQSE